MNTFNIPTTTNKKYIRKTLKKSIIKPTKETEKTKNEFNKQHYLNYEKYCIDLHNKNYPNQKARHWHELSYIDIEKCGYLTMDKIRLNKLKHKNHVKEYGLDGISSEIIDGKTVYHGLQMKLWNDNASLTGSDLGTYFIVVQALREKNIESNETKICQLLIVLD